MANQLKRFWFGDVKLWISFWIYGVCVVALLPYILIYLFTMIEIKSRINAASFFGVLGGLIFLVYGLFAMVGIWKSANKYQGSKKWSLLAKMVVIGFAALLLYNIITIQRQLDYIAAH